MTKTISVLLDNTLVDQLAALATALDRPQAWIIEQAIRRYLEEQAWQVQAIHEALAEYRTGQAELMPHEQVVAEMGALETEIRRSVPE